MFFAMNVLHVEDAILLVINFLHKGHTLLFGTKLHFGRSSTSTYNCQPFRIGYHTKPSPLILINYKIWATNEYNEYKYSSSFTWNSKFMQSSEGNSVSLYVLTLCLAANVRNFVRFFHSSTDNHQYILGWPPLRLTAKYPSETQEYIHSQNYNVINKH